MSYADNDKKFVCVLNGQTPLPQLMNGLAHAMAGLVASLPAGAGEFLDYGNQELALRAVISRFPVIVLKARNGNQLATLRKAVAAAGIAHNAFVSTMIGVSAEAQLEATARASEADLQHFAVVLFGDAAVIDPLTRRFSVFKGGAEVTTT